MTQILVDSILAYDSRLEEYALQELKLTTAINNGGVATITMDYNHPAYDMFQPFKSIVEIYQDNTLKFRGRPHPASEDFNRTRTINCEGELCFLYDVVQKPYLYADSPANIFTALMTHYNSMASTERRFEIGDITVVDDNDYIRLEYESAESVFDTVSKLLNRCGGYIDFTTNTAGKRVINWLADLGRISSQTIEFGENLLDFSIEGDTSTPVPTALMPFGAVSNEETGERLTIASVNNGVEYITNDNAVTLRGMIMATETWDDVTQASNLLRKAQSWLAVNSLLVFGLRLTALDLSLLDKSIRAFQTGDKITVISKPHNVNEQFVLTEKTENLLNPSEGTISLGKDRYSLVNGQASADRQNRNELHKVNTTIRSDVQRNIAKAIETTTANYTSLVEQTERNLSVLLAEEYLTGNEVRSAISTSIEATANGITLDFNRLEGVVDSNNEYATTRFNEISNYIRFEDGNIILGGSDNNITLTIENDRISFKKNGAEFGWWDGENFHTGNIEIEVNEQARFGNFAFVPKSNGSLAFVKAN